MKIGIDLDGVMVATMIPTLKFLNRKYGFNFTMSDIVKYKFEEWIPGWTKEDSKKLFLKKPLYKNTPAIKDSVESVKILMENNFDIEYLTVRDRSLTNTTWGWLERNGLNWEDTHFFKSTDDKIKYLWESNPKFDILVEDSLDVVKEIQSYVFFTFLIDYPYNQRPESQWITRVKGWKEIMKDLHLWGFVK